jgi:hypothetical protein
MMRLLSRKAMLLVSRVSLGLLLFTHLAFAVQACVVPAMSPSVTVEAEAHSHGCHGTQGRLCLTQYLQSDEALDSHPAIASAPSVTPFVTRAYFADVPAVAARHAPETTHLGPPF